MDVLQKLGKQSEIDSKCGRCCKNSIGQLTISVANPTQNTIKLVDESPMLEKPARGIDLLRNNMKACLCNFSKFRCQSFLSVLLIFFALLCALPETYANKLSGDPENYKKLALEARKNKLDEQFIGYENSALALYREKAPSDRTKVAEVYCDLAEFYYERKKYGPAAQNFERCYDIIRPLCSENSVTLIHLVGKLDECYSKLSDKAKAQAFREKNESLCGPFMGKIQRKIKSFWHPPMQTTTVRAQAQFEVNGRGEFLKIHMASPVNPAFDKACLDAVEKTDGKPMQSWAYYAPPIQIEFNFDYNYNNGVGSMAASAIRNLRPDDNSNRVNLTVLNRTNKINQDINQLLKELIAADISKNKMDLPVALLAVTLSEQYLTLGRLESARNLIKGMIDRPAVSQSESPAKILLQAELGCILASEQKLAEAGAILKSVIESPQFEQTTSLTERQRFFKSYGDVLFKQGKEAEANEVYAKRAALKE